VGAAIACGDEAPVADNPLPDAATGNPVDGSVSTATTDAPPVVPDAELDVFCKGSLGLHAPKYANCCNATDAPKTTSSASSALMRSSPSARERSARA